MHPRAIEKIEARKREMVKASGIFHLDYATPAEIEAQALKYQAACNDEMVGMLLDRLTPEHADHVRRYLLWTVDPRIGKD